MNRWLSAVGLSALFLGIGCNGDDDGIVPQPPADAATDSASDARSDAPLADADAGGTDASGTDATGTDASGADASAPDSATDAPLEASSPDAAQAVDAASDVVGE
jgi:hypothetical protein